MVPYEYRRKKQEILKAYEFRFACKNFDTAKQIPDNDFKFILETGRLSPSSFGLEPWKFVVVQDSALREKLRPVSSGAQGQLSTASHLLFVLARKQSGLRFDSPHVNKMMQNIQHMPEDIARFVSSIYKTFTETDQLKASTERRWLLFLKKRELSIITNLG